MGMFMSRVTTSGLSFQGYYIGLELLDEAYSLLTVGSLSDDLYIFGGAYELFESQPYKG